MRRSPRSSGSTSTDSDAGAGLLRARLAQLQPALIAAPSSWQAWALAELPSVEQGDLLHGDYDDLQAPAHRERLGQVFTPRPLARALARWMGADRGGVLLDPASGDGSLLLAAADLRLVAGQRPREILQSLRAWDVDPDALALCRVNLVRWGLENASGRAPGPLVMRCRDALEADGTEVDAVISNPPYLEAKRMGRASPGLNGRLRARFPQLRGAFDLYMAFVYRALELCPRGAIGLLVPNKITQGRYAAALREQLLAEDRLAGLWDLSRMKPRPFPRAGVYPVLLHLKAGSEHAVVGRSSSPEELEAPPTHTMDPKVFRTLGSEAPLFVPFAETWPALEPLLSGDRLGDVARVVTTCSFHHKGLRERFVTPDEPDSFAHPYLGGPSRARQVEICPFAQRWAGWWVRYDEKGLREEKNPLPPLGNFLRPKVVFNQHDRRMTAWADREGRFVTKDVYPVAWPTHPDWTLAKLVAVLNSTVFTALYNTFFQGIVVGGETYHYLPAFLKSVPVPDASRLADIESAVWALHASWDPLVWLAIDRAVATAWDVSEVDRVAMVETHLIRVGAPYPGMNQPR